MTEGCCSGGRSPDSRRPKGSAALRRGWMLTVAALLALSAGLGRAQQVPGSVWTLDRALAQASREHPSVRERLSGLQAAERGLEGKQWLRYPGVALQSATASQGGPATNFRVQMPLWTANRIGSEIEGATASVAAAESGVREAQRDIGLQVVDAFGEMLRLRDRLSAAEENVAEHLRLRDMIRRRVDSEISPIADLLLAQARLSQAEAERTQFLSALENARQALAQAIGARVTDVVAPPLRRPPVAALEDLVRDALASSPLYQRLGHEIEVARQQVAFRKASLLPQVLLRYDRLLGGDSFTRDSRVSVVLEYETGAGLSAASAVAEAQARVDALAHARETAERDLRRRIAEEFNGAMSLAEQVELFRRLADSNLEVKESFRRQFVVGRKSWIEVLNAQREAAQAQFSLADARWSAQRFAYRLGLTTGDPSLAPNAAGGGGGKADVLDTQPIVAFPALDSPAPPDGPAGSGSAADSIRMSPCVARC